MAQIKGSITVFPARAGVIPDVHDTASFVISKIDTIIGSAIGIDIRPPLPIIDML